MPCALLLFCLKHACYSRSFIPATSAFSSLMPVTNRSARPISIFNIFSKARMIIRDMTRDRMYPTNPLPDLFLSSFIMRPSFLLGGFLIRLLLFSTCNYNKQKRCQDCHANAKCHFIFSYKVQECVWRH